MIAGSRATWKLLLLVFLAALMLRVTATARFVGLQAPPDYDAQPDQVGYESLAARMSQGLGYTHSNNRPTAYRPPGTSFFLLPVYVLFGHSYLAGRLWFCLASAATCLVAYAVADRAYGGNTGLWAALLVAFYPGHFYYSMHFVSEGPFALFVLLACWLTILSLTRRATSGAIAAGICWGFATLVRPNAVLVLPLGWLAVLSVRDRKRLVRNALIQMIAVACVVFPWLARNRVVMGAWTMARVSGPTFYGAHNEQTLQNPATLGRWEDRCALGDVEDRQALDEALLCSTAWKKGLATVRAHWQKLPYWEVMKVWRLIQPFEPTPNRKVMWAFSLSWLAIAPCLVVGVVIAWRRSQSATIVLVIPLLAVVLTALIFYGATRFRHSVAPNYLVLSAVALDALSTTLLSRFRSTSSSVTDR